MGQLTRLHTTIIIVNTISCRRMQARASRSTSGVAMLLLTQRRLRNAPLRQRSIRNLVDVDQKVAVELLPYLHLHLLFMQIKRYMRLWNLRPQNGFVIMKNRTEKMIQDESSWMALASSADTRKCGGLCDDYHRQVGHYLGLFSVERSFEQAARPKCR